MGFDIATLGQGAASDVIGAGIGIATQGIENQQQLQQQQKLQNQQMQGQEALMKFQEGVQMDMWNKTNYAAQVEQLNKAGLNPALLYGKGGGGGMSVGGGMPSTGGAQANNNANAAMSGMGIVSQQMAQLELMKAQKENIDADTANKKTENPNIVKTGALIDANTNNAQANTALQKANTVIADAQGKIQQGTIEEQIRTLSQTAAQLDETVDSLHRMNFIGDATKYTQIAQARADLAKTVVDKQMDQMTTSLTEQQRNLVKQQSAKYMDLLATQMGLMSRQGIAAMSQAGSADEMTSINNQKMELERSLRDQTDSEKSIMELLDKIAQAVGLRGALTPTTKPNSNQVGPFNYNLK